ncbi:TPA: hypothetical protein ACTW9A_001209 [Raoultella planticola]
MTDYALIRNGTVDNVVVWDGEGELFGDYTTCKINTGEVVGPGFLAEQDGGGNWIFTAPSVVISAEEQAKLNLQAAQAEYARATTKITSLNERVEDGDYAGTSEDVVKALLSGWVRYRKALRAYISAADGGIELPSAPEA